MAPPLDKIFLRRPLPPNSTEFYVKWKGMAHIHSQWVPRVELDYEAATSPLPPTFPAGLVDDLHDHILLPSPAAAAAAATAAVKGMERAPIARNHSSTGSAAEKGDRSTRMPLAYSPPRPS